jgi:hypothetical protein
MYVRTLPFFRFIGKLASISAACLFGAAVLWWVARHAGPNQGTALIHVTEPDVVVCVGDRTFLITDRRNAPIECDLPAGRHTLSMKRFGETLYQEDFELERGGEVILTAWRDRSKASARDNARAIASFHVDKQVHSD